MARCLYLSRERSLRAATVLLKKAVVATVLAAFFWGVREREREHALPVSSSVPSSVYSTAIGTRNILCRFCDVGFECWSTFRVQNKNVY